MSDERPTQGGLEMTQEDIATLRQRYRTQDVLDLFGRLGLPVCDDGAIITQVASREKARKQQESQSPNPKLRQEAAAWLTADELLENQSSRRALLLIVQEEVNRMFTFRIELLGRDSKPYTPEVRAELLAAAMRGFKLSEDLNERFMRAFEHAGNLRFGARAPMVVPRIDVWNTGVQTFASPLTTLLPPLPQAEREPWRPTEPLPAIRVKPANKRASAPLPAAERKPSGPLLTPANAKGKLLLQQDDQSQEWLLNQESFSIGRLPESDLCLKDDLRVSRQHAVIHRAPTAFLLTDLGSGNGTFLNGIRLEIPVALQSGDHIRIGHTELTFVLEPVSAHHS